MGGLVSSNKPHVGYENASVFGSRQAYSSNSSYTPSSSGYTSTSNSIKTSSYGPSPSSSSSSYNYNPYLDIRNLISDSDDCFYCDNNHFGIVNNPPSQTKLIEANLPSEQITRCPMFKSYMNSNVVSYTLVTPDSLDYRAIKKLVKNNLIKIDKILKVNNEFLEKSYELKKEEKIARFRYGVKEHLLFHGTSEENAINICKNNFDWRLCNRHRFGKGVNFSSSAKYASDSIKKVNCKVLIVAKVLIFKSHQGDQFTTLPQDGYDTTGKNDYDAIVQVKYEDAEFCPAYLIYYRMTFVRKR